MPFENYSKAHMFEAKMLSVDERLMKEKSFKASQS